MSATDRVLLSIDPNTDHPIAGDTVVYTADNDAVFGGTVEESHQDVTPSATWRFRIIGHDALFNHESEAWRSRVISRPAIERTAGTVGTARVRCKEGEYQIAGAWVTGKGGTYFTPFLAEPCGHNLFYGESVLDFVPDVITITPDHAAEVLYLNEVGRPWADANQSDRSVYGNAGAAVVRRLRGESR